MKIKRFLSLVSAILLMSVSLYGQIVNPVPQEMTVEGKRFLDISRGIVIEDVKGRFSEDLAFLPKSRKGVVLTIDYGQKVALQAKVKEVSGAYSLTVSAKGISIVGYDERGAFYGIQTLRQIVGTSPAEGRIPRCTVNDWPDIRYRGVVEGFYGTPWSHQTRLSLIDFYGRFKLNTYIYGPKDDPYHSSPHWRMPYPPKQADEIKELIAACRRNRVDFVWAVHPGKDIQWNEEDYSRLSGKFEMMYYLGVRSFAIFFDDISGEGAMPSSQVEFVNRIMNDFIKKRRGVTGLIVCPTDYSRLWANPGPNGNLCIYGRELDPAVNIFWTGDSVCSDLTVDTMDWLNSRIQRPGFFWWNYPVTDYVRHILMQGPVYGLSGEMTSERLGGFVSNPMEHGEASKLAIYSVADYTWNVSAYEPLESWERALTELAPEVRDAYRTFAIHSCDTEDGYRRDESWETETFSLDTYTPEKYDALMTEFRKMEEVPTIMENCENKALLEELRPWLAEFGKLAGRCRRTLECFSLYQEGDISGFWAAYADNLMTDEEIASYKAHRCGTFKLQPFYENMMAELADAFNERYKGRVEYSHVHEDGMDVYTAPADASHCHLILNNPSGKDVVVRLSDAAGRYVAEFCVNDSYFEFDLKSDARKVEVIGADEIYEIIFVR
ncbi:MAG: beta-N-acetylglucosaminidase domain-containing protein [Bacteroidales bacterium]|nr:beta-N-acetylglucosaminidase domain-containing protein [Bacteroidales bacterium]